MSNSPRLLTWGRGKDGQLGHGGNKNSQSPLAVEALDGRKVAKVALGYCHSAAVTDEGALFTWGRGALGLLGHGDLCDEALPRLIQKLRSVQVSQVACGVYHTMVLAGGHVYTWGWGNDGRLGHGEDSYLLTPKLLTALEGQGVATIECGYYHSAATTNDGRLYTWGAGAHGRLGHGSVDDVKTPCIVQGLEAVRQVGCGGYHTAALVDTGVMSWGHGANGRLGHGDGEDVLLPAMVQRLLNAEMLQVACGEHHTALLMRDGRVLTWGRGAFGRLGLGDESDSPFPQEVSCLSDLGTSQIECGVYHTIARTARGVYMWGTETTGQASQDGLLPSLIAGSDRWKVEHVSSGGFHVGVLTRGGADHLGPKNVPKAARDLSADLDDTQGEQDDGTAIAARLHTVTSADTRRKLRDALAGHGASTSRPRSSASRSNSSAPSPTTPAPHSLTLPKGSGGMSVKEAVETARLSYARRAAASPSLDSTPSTPYTPVLGNSNGNRARSATSCDVDKMIERARQAGMNRSLSSSQQSSGHKLPDSAGKVSLSQLQSASSALRKDLREIWKDSGSQERPSQLKEIQELEGVVSNLEEAVQQQQLSLEAKQSALDNEIGRSQELQAECEQLQERCRVLQAEQEAAPRHTRQKDSLSPPSDISHSPTGGAAMELDALRRTVKGVQEVLGCQDVLEGARAVVASREAVESSLAELQVDLQQAVQYLKQSALSRSSSGLRASQGPWAPSSDSLVNGFVSQIREALESMQGDAEERHLAMEARLEAREEEIRLKEGRLSEVQRDELQAREELAHAVARAEQLQRDNEELRNGEGRADSEHKEVLEKLESAEQDCRELGEEYARLSIEWQSLKEHLEENRAEREALSAENTTLQEDMQTLLQESEEGKKHLQAAEADYKQHAEDMEAITKDLTELRASNTELSEEVLRLQAMHKGDVAFRAKLEEEFRKSDEAHSRTEASKAELLSTLQSLQGEGTEQAGRMLELETTVTQVSAARDFFKDEVDRLTAELEESVMLRDEQLGRLELGGQREAALREELEEATEKVSRLSAAHSEEVARLNGTHREEMAIVGDKGSGEVGKLQEEVGSLNARYAEDVARLNEKHAEEAARWVEEEQGRLEEAEGRIRAAHVVELTRIDEVHAEAVGRLNQAHKEEVALLSEKAAANANKDALQIEALQEKLNELNAAVELKEQLRKELLSAQQTTPLELRAGSPGGSPRSLRGSPRSSVSPRSSPGSPNSAPLTKDDLDVLECGSPTCRDCRELMRQLQEERARGRIASAEMDGMQDSMLREIDELKSKSVGGGRAELRGPSDELQNEIEQLKAKLAASEPSAEAERAAAEAWAEAQELRQNAAELAELLGDAEREIEELKKRKFEHHEAVDAETLARLRASEEEVDGVKDSLATAQAQCTEAEVNLANLGANLAEREGTLAAAKEQNGKLQAELADSQAALSECRVALGDCQAALSASEADQKALGDSQASLESLRSELSECLEQQQQTTTALRDCEETLQRAQEELAARTAKDICLTEPAQRGSTVLVSNNINGLGVGDRILMNPGGGNEERATISGFGSISMLLEEPLCHGHERWEIIAVERAPASKEEEEEAGLQLAIESKELQQLVLALRDRGLDVHSKEMVAVTTEMEVIEAKLKNMQRSNEEQRSAILELEVMVEEIEGQVDAMNHDRAMCEQRGRHEKEVMELQYQTAMHQHQVGMDSIQQAVALMETKSHDLQLSNDMWERRYAQLQSQARNERSDITSQCQTLQAQLHELRLALDTKTSENAAARRTQDELQSQIMQLRDESSDAVLQREIQHEAEMAHGRDLLAAANDKETVLQGQLQEAAFSTSMRSMDFVTHVQSLARMLHYVRHAVATLPKVSLDVAKALDPETITLDQIESRDVLTRADESSQEICEILHLHAAELSFGMPR